MKTIPLSQGKVAVVDDEDFANVSRHKWCAVRCGSQYYAMRARVVDGKTRYIYMHRELLGFPKGKRIDHINHEGLDNRRSNLRLASRSQNAMNMQKKAPHSSRYKGVSWSKHQCKWVAYICPKGQYLTLGSFTDEENAAIAYNVAAQLFFGEFALLNPI